MAQKIQVLLVDDLDGGTATETVSFSLDGATYEIDLTAKNAAKLRDAFAPYVGAARRSGGRAASRTARRAPRKAAAAPAGTGKTALVRAWARSKNIKVSERGRISADVVAKYDAAH